MSRPDLYSGDVAIRLADPEDVELVAQLAADTFALACPSSTPEADIESHITNELNATKFAHDLAVPGVAIYVAYSGDEAIGYAMLRGIQTPPVGIESHRPMEIKQIYVREAHHGNGAANLLFDECIRHARTHDYDAVWLGTNQENNRALSFYRRMGFVEVGTRKFRVNSSVECDYVMARVLDGQQL